MSSSASRYSTRARSSNNAAASSSYTFPSSQKRLNHEGNESNKRHHCTIYEITESSEDEEGYASEADDEIAEDPSDHASITDGVAFAAEVAELERKGKRITS